MRALPGKEQLHTHSQTNVFVAAEDAGAASWAAQRIELDRWHANHHPGVNGMGRTSGVQIDIFI